MDSFYTGQIFQNVQEVKNHLNFFNEQNFTEFRISCNNSRSMQIHCKHARERKSRSKGLRPNLHVNYLGCNAKIILYKSQKPGNSTLKVTQSNLDHENHIIDENVYKYNNIQVSQEEEDLIKVLAEANTKPSRIQKVILKRHKKKIGLKKLRNLVGKIVPKDDDVSRQDFEKYLDGVDNDGGVVEWDTDADGSINALFITTYKMKAAFENSDPPVIQLDTSFNFDKAQYKLAAFVYLDPTTGLSEIAALAFISQETANVFEYILGKFARMCSSHDMIFLIDKDFTEIASIKKIFPGSIVLLCCFHVMKYIRCLVSTALTTQDVKNDIYSQFNKVLYSKREDIFEVENQLFLDMIDNVQVRSGKNYVNFKSYYIKNWESSKEMWVRYFRNSMPLLGDNTSNRVESSFNILKKSVEDTFISLPHTIHAVQHLCEFANDRISERYSKLANKVLRIVCDDEQINELNKLAAKDLNDLGCKLFNKVLSKLDDRMESLDIFENGVREKFSSTKFTDYLTTESNCNCSFFYNMQAPCHHILFVRKISNLSNPESNIFDRELFHRRYHRIMNIMTNLESRGEATDFGNEDICLNPAEEFSETEDTEEVEKVLDNNKKYKDIMPILLRIGNIISLHGTKNFKQYKSELECVERNVRQGRSIFLTSSTSECMTAENLTHVLGNNNISPQDHDSETVYTDCPLENNGACTDGQNLEIESSVNDAVPTRFQNISLKFKQSIISKGRPRKKGKQVCFNKTALDKKKISRKKAMGQQERNFIENDEESQIDEANYSRFQPYRVLKPTNFLNSELNIDLDDEKDISSDDGSGSNYEVKEDDREIMSSENEMLSDM